VRVADETTGESVVAITPSSRDYRTLSPEDICVVDLAGQMRAGTSAPSVETTAHLGVYAAGPTSTPSSTPTSPTPAPSP
jgi:L-fuculose-phosphate aldolase